MHGSTKVRIFLTMLPDFGPRLRIKKIGPCLWVRPKGELDVNAANLLSKNIVDRLGDTPSMPVVFDLASVDYINSTVLGLLVHLVKVYQEKGLDLIFYRPSKFALRLFEETCLLSVIRICHSRTDLPPSIRP